MCRSRPKWGEEEAGDQVALELLGVRGICPKKEKKESSKREVKIGTTPSLEKDVKAIKVFPGC